MGERPLFEVIGTGFYDSATDSLIMQNATLEWCEQGQHYSYPYIASGDYTCCAQCHEDLRVADENAANDRREEDYFASLADSQAEYDPDWLEKLIDNNMGEQ